MGSSVLITGANRGLGLALCKVYAEKFYNVIALCRCDNTDLKSISNIQIIDGVDYLKEKNYDFLKDVIKKTNIDIIIHNAGLGNDDDITSFEFNEIISQYVVNAVAPLSITKSLQELLRPGSKVAFISSRLASIYLNQKSQSYAYRMSKAALNMAAKNLSIDLKHRGIAVGIYSPGLVDTDMLRNLGNYSGVSPQIVATELCALIETLTIDTTGQYWHIDGKILPW